jgi:hypothetical protein
VAQQSVDVDAYLFGDSLLDESALLVLALEDGSIVTWLVLYALQGRVADLGRGPQRAGQTLVEGRIGTRHRLRHGNMDRRKERPAGQLYTKAIDHLLESRSISFPPDSDGT